MLDRKLKHLVKIGRLTVIGPSGGTTTYGSPDGAHPRPDVTVRLRSAMTGTRIALHPDLALGEAYMSGDLTIERGSLWNLLELCGLNLERMPHPAPGSLLKARDRLAAAFREYNNRGTSRSNVAHHYDLSDSFYRLFLDEDLQYSCAYFDHPGASLAEAQLAKKRHIAAKLCLASGQRVLDIGCGWGGLALSIAQAEHVEVLGITLSREQLAIAQQRAAKLGLAGRVRFELMHYRDVPGSFDRVVSVGMFEHVGRPNYGAFLRKVSEVLAEDGIALLHSIGRMHGPSTTSSWIRRYVFPGGYIPALSEVLPHIEAAGLWLTDLEILRLHYAETLRLWRERFLDRRSVATDIYDERFCRMWEFYLAVSEMSFRYRGFMVFQAQLSRKIGAVPLTRDYMHAEGARPHPPGDPIHASVPQRY